MIRGYFEQAPGQPRPFVSGLLNVPAAGRQPVQIDFLVDTGADRTALAPFDIARLHLDWSRVEPGTTGIGIGGVAETQTTRATLTLDDLAIDLQLTILSTPPGTRPLPLPSLLGRDVLHRFCLIIDAATERVLLLTPEERDQLTLP